MKNYRLFILKYIPVTNTQPARLRITDTRFKKSIIISRGMGQQFVDDAITTLNLKGIDIVGRAWNEIKDEDYLFTDNFETQIKGGKK